MAAMAYHRFPAPDPVRSRPRIFPVFIPFRGCATRCVFCAQTLQTGTEARSASAVLADLEDSLERMARASSPPCEVAFYGGTFTALPETEQAAFLELAARYREKGLVTRVRASTRPDAVSPVHLRALHGAGLDILELGVQSFADAALAVSDRNYNGETAEQGCRYVRESGLELCIQLMPGMPGMRAVDFTRDLERTLNIAPVAVRLYPCLVLAGTELAVRYARGEFFPWPLTTVLRLLTKAQLAFWRAGIPIIRMGVAPQSCLENGGFIAGPAHPALGSMVRGLALYRYIQKEFARLRVPKGRVTRLILPRRLQGDVWGYGKSLVEPYAAMGITRQIVTWSNDVECAVEFDG